MKWHFTIQYVSYLAWSILSGAFCFFVTFNTFGSVMGSDGHVNNMYNTAICVYLSIVVAHHVQVCIELRSFNPVSVFFICFSTCLVLLVIFLNNQFKSGTYTGYYYGNQYSVMMASPLFFLCVFLNAFVICLPNALNRIAVDVIFYPEFSKIRGD